jgi:hypothetical protein
LDGYTQESSIRTTKIGGGITLYINDQLDYKTCDDLNHSDNEIESIWIEIDKDKIGTKKNSIIGCIYRSPGTDISTFNDYLITILDIIKRENKI